jgi:hypothetical protein
VTTFGSPFVPNGPTVICADAERSLVSPLFVSVPAESVPPKYADPLVLR